MRDSFQAIMVVVLLFWCFLVCAQSPVLDRDEVLVFSDSYIEQAMMESGALGVTLAIVQGSDVVLLKGYGSVRVTSMQPVDAERTLFRLGSITKPMTALAILSFVESGEIHLDTDVNVYLRRVQVPKRATGPVTIRHLLTHRGGMDSDPSFSLLGPAGTSSQVDDAQIARRLQRVRESGMIAAYDVLGFGLLGLVLEDVSGKPFDQVLNDVVLGPIGMEHSVAGLPLNRLPDFIDCAITRGPSEVIACEHLVLANWLRGSGDVASSAGDMSRFMMMLLGRGALEGQNLYPQGVMDGFLDFESYRVHPSGPGLGLGIREFQRKGRCAFGHGGGITGFNNQMDLFPDSGVGIYIGIAGGPDQVYDVRLSSIHRLMANGRVPSAVAEAQQRLETFPTAFAVAFLDESLRSAQRDPFLKSDTSELAGLYFHSRFRSNNLMMKLSRMSLAVEVEDRGEGRVAVLGDELEETEPLLFKGDRFELAFHGRGDQMFLAFGADPYRIYERVAGYRGSRYSLLPLPIFLLVLILGAFYTLPRFPRVLRLAAAFWAGGAVVFGCALLLELEYATWFIEVKGSSVALFWRCCMWGAVALMAIAPLLTWRLPPAEARGFSFYLGRVHGLLMTVGGWYLAVWLLTWWP